MQMGYDDRLNLHIDVEVRDLVEKDEALARENIARFHWLAYRLDGDWPYAKDKDRRQFSVRVKCLKCGGVEYNSPLLDVGAVKVLGKQLGLEVKIRQWRPGEKCRKTLKVGEVLKMEPLERWQLIEMEED